MDQRKIDARSRTCLDGLDLAMLHPGSELPGLNGEKPRNDQDEALMDRINILKA